MADQKFTLNIDDDWKRQAQEEKRRLAEQEAKNKQAAAPAPAPATAEPTEVAGSAEAVDETSPFGGLVRTLLTQTLVYLGAGQRQGMPMNLDAARRSLDFLGVLDDKAKGNLSPDEQKLLDTALYQARNQFVAVASQLLGP
jgi:hypothetical protein